MIWIVGNLLDPLFQSLYQSLILLFPYFITGLHIDNYVFVILADIISCVEFNDDGELLATGDKGGRVVIFQRDQTVTFL